LVRISNPASPTNRTEELSGWLMNIEGAVVLVTGANRGLGAEYVRQLLDRGAAKVYAGARSLESVKTSGAIPIKLDVTNAADIQTAVAQCNDLTMLINNAGVVIGSRVLAENSLENAKAEFETNVWGPMNLSKAFAPVLAANGGGAIVNVLSAVSWMSIKEVATYAMSKSAAWSLTNALRLELARQGTLVVAVHPAFIDTDMAAGVDMPKTSPQQVVERTLDGVAAGLPEVLADDTSAFVKNSLPRHIETFYPKVADPRP
jgi:NAD(P)-dependent dehydrogenase (short-subunit alcohol dehydrogenase family)